MLITFKLSHQYSLHQFPALVFQSVRLINPLGVHCFWYRPLSDTPCALSEQAIQQGVSGGGSNDSLSLRTLFSLRRHSLLTQGNIKYRRTSDLVFLNYKQRFHHR